MIKKREDFCHITHIKFYRLLSMLRWRIATTLSKRFFQVTFVLCCTDDDTDGKPLRLDCRSWKRFPQLSTFTICVPASRSCKYWWSRSKIAHRKLKPENRIPPATPKTMFPPVIQKKKIVLPTPGKRVPLTANKYLAIA